MSGFLGAVQFLTRLPLRRKAAPEHRSVVPWFGIVGCLIGAAVGAVAALLSHFVAPFVTAACAITFGLLLTGAFHEDGLADTADAFGGGNDRERRLEIMKDSRHGTYGVTALAASIVVRVAAVSSVAAPGSWSVLLRSFVVAHGVARAAAMGVMLVVPPATTDDLSSDYLRQLRKPATVLGMAVTVGVAWLLLGAWVWLVVAVVAAGAVLTALLAMRKIGGLVGDVLGAVEQVGECLALVVISGLVTRSWIV